MALNSSPRTWVAGETVTAAEMNAEIRDAFIGVQAAWTAFTPTWTAASVNPVLGNGTIVGRWTRTGKTADFFYQITMGSTTTYGTGQWILSIPATLNNARFGTGLGDAFDASAASDFPISTAAQSTTSFALRGWPGAAGAAWAAVNSTVPFTWATGDILTISFRAELA